MKEQLKDMARPYAMLFLIALAVAIVGRIGLAVMDLTGTLSYDYISAADVPILDVVCSILTGSALVAFMYAASLAMVVSTAGVALHGLLFSRRSEGAGRPATAFLWGWATALAAIVCLLITASGILSAVQVASMSSKLPSLPMLVLAPVGFAAFLGTLLGAASMTVCACLARARDEKRAGWNLVLAAFVCGLVVMVLTVGTFSSVNAASIQLGTVGAWFAADVVVNLAIMFGMGAGEEGSRVAWNPGRVSPFGQGEARPSFRKYPSVRRVDFRRAGRARFP